MSLTDSSRGVSSQSVCGSGSGRYAAIILRHEMRPAPRGTGLLLSETCLYRSGGKSPGMITPSQSCLRYTIQKEPAFTVSFLAAVLLAIAARYLGLTDEDLAILGPVMLIVAGVVIRAGVFAPDTVRDLLGPEEPDEP